MNERLKIRRGLYGMGWATLPEEPATQFNPNHDELGRFAPGGGGTALADEDEDETRPSAAERPAAIERLDELEEASPSWTTARPQIKDWRKSPITQTERNTRAEVRAEARAAMSIEEHSLESVWGPDGVSPVQDVPVSDIISNQNVVSHANMMNLLGPRDVVRYPTPPEPVHIIKTGGKYLIWDGNHRAAAMFLAGRRTIRAEVFDLDARRRRAGNVALPDVQDGDPRDPFYLAPWPGSVIEGVLAMHFNENHDDLGRFASADEGQSAGASEQTPASGVDPWERAFGGSGKRTYVGTFGKHRVVLKPTRSGWIAERDDDVRQAGFKTVGESKRWVEREWGTQFNPHHDELGRFAPSPDTAYPPANPDGLDTQQRFKRDDGTYTEERAALHDRLVGEAFAGKTPVPDGQVRTVTVMGGGPASGKSVLVQSEGLTADEYTVHADADRYKEGLPEFVAGVARGDAGVGTYVHEESSDLHKRTVVESVNGGFNVVVDGTGDNTIEQLEKKSQGYRARGHRLVGHYVSCDVETAIERAEVRGRQTGRYVPETYMRQTHRSVSVTVQQAISRGVFDELTIWDTNGPRPVRAASARGSQLTIHDRAAWEAFVAKGTA